MKMLFHFMFKKFYELKSIAKKIYKFIKKNCKWKKRETFTSINILLRKKKLSVPSRFALEDDSHDTKEKLLKTDFYNFDESFFNKLNG